MLHAVALQGMGEYMNRFIALDSWRGICACLVCLFHFKETAFSHASYSKFVRNSYLFVDFFFV
jgi:peptidoglycan/LPS O-acetylase OafA/YrhL